MNGTASRLRWAHIVPPGRCRSSTARPSVETLGHSHIVPLGRSWPTRATLRCNATMSLKVPRSHVFPELDLFENPQARDRGFRHARDGTITWRRCMLLTLVGWIPVGVLYYWLGITGWWWAVPFMARAAVYVVLSIILVVAANYIYREPIRRSLREQLRASGVPICVHCGYDLRASRERCPECGTAFDVAVPPAGGAVTDDR